MKLFRKEEQIVAIYDSIEAMKKLLEDKGFVECKECGCLLRSETALKVQTCLVFSGNKYTDYYCKIHKPPYDKVYSGDIPQYYKNEVQCDKDGKIKK